MAFNAGSVEGSLELEADDFLRALRQTRGELDKLRKDQKRATSSTSRFQRALQTAANATIVAFGAIRTAKAVVGPLVGAFKEASAAAAEYDQAVDALASTLAIRGAEGVAKLTSELEGQAARLQQATAFGDTDVLGVQQTLSALGIAIPKVEEYTQVILDVAAATGRDANETAKQFAKTQAGLLGELGETIPALRGISKEALESGAAFDKAGDLFGGFAELVGQTDQSIFATFQQTLNDVRKEVGFLINEVAGPLAQTLTKKMAEVVESIKGGGAAADNFREAIAQAATFGAKAFEAFLVGVAEGFQTFREAQVLVRELQVALLGATRAGIEGFLELNPLTSKFLRAIADGGELLGAFGSSTGRALASVADSLADIEDEGQAAADRFRGMEENAKGLRDEAFKTLAATNKIVDSTKAAGAELVKQVEAAVGTTEEYRKQTGAAKALLEFKRQQVAEENRIANAAAEQQKAADERLAKLREINGVSGQVAGATEGIASGAARAAGEAGKMAQGFREAAGAANSAADAANRAAAGRNPDGSLDFESIPISREVASRSEVDFSDPFRARAHLDTAREGARRARGNAFFGASIDRAARATLDSVRAQASASIERAVSEFTGEVLRELNEGGIDDPARRSRILRERLAEARRLGIIPSEGAARSI